jgi:dTDP-4-dehydrorhamnose 3,5-epimerase
MGFRFQAATIPAVVLVEPDLFLDSRGRFLETFRASVFLQHGIPPFVQDNRSESRRHVLRGLHFQLPPHAQGKLVGCVAGEILDVAVDLRRDADTFGRHVAVKLSRENGRMLYIPPGFAHGFLVLSDEAIVTYKVTAEYAPAAERGLRWNDPALAIAWPVEQPILSAKDADYPPLAEVAASLPANGAAWLSSST